MSNRPSNNGSITNTVVVGFLTMILIIFSLAVYILYELQEVHFLSSRVRDLRTPTFEASSSLQSNILGAQSSLRGIILMNSEKQRQNFNNNWRKINQSIEQMKELSVNWTNPENKEKLAIIEENLQYLSDVQNEMISRYSSRPNSPSAMSGVRPDAGGGSPNREIMTLGAETSETGVMIINLLEEVVASQKLLQQADNIALDNRIGRLNLVVFLASALSVLFSVWLAITITRRTRKIEAKSIARNNLIDQNILISTMDKNGVIIDISNSLCRELGNRKENIVGKQSDYFINGDDKENQINEINSVIQTGFRWEGEISITKPSGDVHWYSSSIIPSSSVDSKRSYFTNILVNITDKKYNELLSITDKLTGIYNRRHFDKTLEKQILIARRRKSLLSLAILDIDYFKQYNDRYGHPDGDKVLRKVAQTIKKSLHRPDDFVFRLGGEEFGILFSASNLEQSQIFLEKIRTAIEGLKIKHEESDLGPYLTVSIGAACSDGNNIPSAIDYYDISDNALYEAKVNRNSVEIVGL